MSNFWRCKFSCYDWDEDDNDDLIGCVDVTLRQLIDTKDSGVCTFLLMIFSGHFRMFIIMTDWLLWLWWRWDPRLYWGNQYHSSAIARDQTDWGKISDYRVMISVVPFSLRWFDPEFLQVYLPFLNLLYLNSLISIVNQL